MRCECPLCLLVRGELDPPRRAGPPPLRPSEFPPPFPPPLARAPVPGQVRAGDIILTAGGVWDRVEKAYVPPPPGHRATSRRLFVQDAQLPAARWYARWLAARQRGEHVLGPNGKPCFAVAMVGGRRGGKSDITPKIVLPYLLAFPGAIGWIVIPEYPDMAELERALEGMLPRKWYRATGGGGDQSLYLQLADGSEWEILSGRDADKLKRGRADIVVIHEAQKQGEKVYAMVRPAVADRGGLVVIAANPPDTASGEWVADFVERARSTKTGNIAFEIDPRLNPHVDQEALLSLKDELDERTYRREILGEFLARTDVVMFAFSPSTTHGNVRPEGTDEHGRPLVNVTREFTQRMLGHACDQVHGLDFQLGPYMAAATARFYRDPEDPNGDPLCWFVDDLEVPQATEGDLVSALEGRGYTGEDACVPDATGEFQGGERIKGRSSWDEFRKRGWRRLYFPVATTRANPHKTDRLANGNSLFRTASGRRRCFVDPKCAYLIRALRLWEMRNGVPHWRSDYAHIIDAATYLLCRLFPRAAPAAKIEYIKVERPTRGGWEDIGGRKW